MSIKLPTITLTDDQGYQTGSLSEQFWWEMNHWKTKKTLFLSSHHKNANRQVIEFVGYQIATAYQTELFLLTTGEVVLYNNDIIYRYPTFEEIAKTIIECKAFSDRIYEVFDYIGKKSLLCKPLPEGGVTDLSSDSTDITDRSMGHLTFDNVKGFQ